jgi:hypothetical protein
MVWGGMSDRVATGDDRHIVESHLDQWFTHDGDDATLSVA